MNKAEKEAYNEAINRFNGCCALCGRNNIHLHHIRYGAEGRKTYIGNIIPLCEEHHRAVHQNKKYWQPILLQITEKSLDGESYTEILRDNIKQIYGGIYK